ncbi:MAG: glycosyl hydrolase [Bacteroidota bacterium]
MFGKIFKIVGWLVVGLLLLVVGAVAYFYYQLIDGVQGKTYDTDRPSVVQYYDESYDKREDLPFFETFDFNLQAFEQPDLRFGPFTRWWWPGNDVSQAELRREINLFKEVGIAGVEIQPFTMGLNLKKPADQLEGVHSWDTPVFYDNLKVVMETAKEAGLTVDLNTGGGWPTGGHHVNLRDNFQQLLYSEVNVSGGKKVRIDLPIPDAPLSAYMSYLLGRIANLSVTNMGKQYPDLAEIETVVAAKVLADNRTKWAIDTEDQIELDASSKIVLDEFVDKKARTLEWTAPEGNWQIVVFWSTPADEPPILIPTDKTTYVVDHFDSTKVIANYNYLFGKRTGLEPYYGRPFRALFNDSYEFAVERHYATNFFDFFERQRGYDIRPWLPATMSPGHNHVYAHLFKLQGLPAFKFSEEDWRLQHDYDLTISEMLLEQFFDSSHRWMGERNLSHRTQGYGLPMDVIGAAGRAHIPEAEQLFGDGSYAFLKMVSSGAHLYKKPLTTAESVVYQERAHMTTPQKIKLSVDKAFTSGINQIIYHGTAYNYQNGEYGKDGWFPWASPYSAIANFSSDLREVNNFWSSMPHLNTYIARAQYALQAGQPQTDALVYFPFLGIPYEKGISDSTEVLPIGHFVGVEPKIISESFRLPGLSTKKEKSESAKWLLNSYATLNRLDERGIGWDWGNEESILAATVEDGQLVIRGQRFAALVLPNVPHLSLPLAQKIAQLVQAGASIHFVGDLPKRQAGFKDYAQRDAAVEQTIAASITAGGQHSPTPATFGKALDQLPVTLKFQKPTKGIKHISRELSDGSTLTFFANNHADWHAFELISEADFAASYWLNPATGERYSANDNLMFQLPPYGSIILYQQKAVVDAATATTASRPVFWQNDGKSIVDLTQWDVQIGDFQQSSIALFDWRTNQATKYAGETGVYKTQFELDERQPSTNYVLNLGAVHATAKVELNSQSVGEVHFAPYKIDLTPYLKVGQNQLTVKVQPSNLNEYIGAAVGGDPHYVHLADKADRLVVQGLLGPVRVEVFERGVVLSEALR